MFLCGGGATLPLFYGLPYNRFMLTFWLWVFLLVALLFWPVSQLIWVVSVRRLQRKLNKELNENDLQAQKQRARFVAVVVCFVFSVLYNLARLGMPTDG